MHGETMKIKGTVYFINTTSLVSKRIRIVGKIFVQNTELFRMKLNTE